MGPYQGSAAFRRPRAPTKTSFPRPCRSRTRPHPRRACLLCRARQQQGWPLLSLRAKRDQQNGTARWFDGQGLFLRRLPDASGRKSVGAAEERDQRRSLVRRPNPAWSSPALIPQSMVRQPEDGNSLVRRPDQRKSLVRRPGQRKPVVRQPVQQRLLWGRGAAGTTQSRRAAGQADRSC